MPAPLARPLVPTLAAAGLVALAGCVDEPARSGDPFPIHAGRAAGAFTVAWQSDTDPGGASANPAVVDVLSPVTVIDLEGPPPRRGAVSLTLVAPTTPGGSTLVPRARFDTTALLLHPCTTAGPCTIGDPSAPTSIGAVIGADTLRDDAIRFEPDTSRMFVFDEIAGADDARDEVCDALLPAPFYGGATLEVGDTELGFDGLRIAVDLCLLEAAPTSPDRPLAIEGVDAAMVLSTGLGVSILGEARYEQWRLGHGGPPASALPQTTVLLPAGPITGGLATIPAFDLGGGGSTSRGACRDGYANRLLTVRNCAPADDCPCDNDPICAVPSVLELTTPLDVIVVADTAPVLQALRAELRPARPEIDGILGMNALGAVVLDVDYPHNRVLMRCAAAGCTTRPALAEPSDCAQILGCLGGLRP